jgi:uncharacterized protein
MTALTCPKCQGAMRSYERSGVTLDQCSECRGIFLDRGELEKLVDAEAAFNGGPAAARAALPERRDPDHDRPRYEDKRYDDKRYDEKRRFEDARYGEPRYSQRKKKSFLEELFD